MNLRDYVWDIKYQIIMKTILQEKETIHYSIISWFTNLFLCLKLWKFRQRIAAVDKEWEKLEKMSAWNLTKVRSKKEVIDEARTSGAKVHFALLMDIWKMLNWRQNTSGDVVEDNSESYVVFTEQGSSASQMTAAEIMDIISRLWRTSSRRSIGLHPSENGRYSKSECPDILIRLPRDKMAKIMVQYGRPSRYFCMESVRSSFGRTIMGKAISVNPTETWMGENSKLGMSLCSSWKGLFLSVYVDDIRLAVKKHNIDPMWKLLSKEVDLGEPVSCLDHVYLGSAQRQCEIRKDIAGPNREFPRGVGKLPFSQNNRISSWSYDMEGHAKKCVERYRELANKTTQQLYKKSTPYIDDHHFKKVRRNKICWRIVNYMHSNCSEMLILGKNWTTWYLWPVNKLARPITKWTKACDKRLNRLISYIHHTSEYRQYCHVGNTAKQCRLGLFQDSDFAGDLEVFVGHMYFGKCWIGGKAPKRQRSSCTPRWYC